MTREHTTAVARPYEAIPLTPYRNRPQVGRFSIHVPKPDRRLPHPQRDGQHRVAITTPKNYPTKAHHRKAPDLQLLAPLLTLVHRALYADASKMSSDLSEVPEPRFALWRDMKVETCERLRFQVQPTLPDR